MEQLLIAVGDDILGAAMKGGGIFAAVAVVQLLIIGLFIRLSRTINTLALTVSTLAGQVANLASQDDLKEMDQAQKKVNEILHDRCTKLSKEVARVDGICHVLASKGK